MALIARHQSIAEVKRGSAHEQIGKRDHDSIHPGFGIDPRDEPADLRGKRFGGDRGKDRIQIAAPFGGLLRRLGAINTVLQFNYADGGEHDLRHHLPTLGNHEHTGVQH